MSSFIRIFTCCLILCCGITWSELASQSQTKDELAGFVPIFDGKTLNGWHKLTTIPEDQGSKWEVIDGVLVGDQDPPGVGGLLVTDKKFSDIELYAEVKADYPCDSGLFLRMQPNALSYQITLDYRPNGEVGGIHVPRGGGFVKHCPMGITYWHPTEYNKVRVRCVGQPPRIQVWIGDKLVNDYQDVLVEGKPRVPESGVIAVQVHSGKSWGKGNKIRFRKLMVKELK